MKKLFIFTMIALFGLSANTLHAQRHVQRTERALHRAERENLSHLARHKNYTFVAEGVLSPNRTESLRLSGLNGLWVTKNQVKVFLPLYGTPSNPRTISQSVDFARDKYRYKVKRFRHGGHHVTIRSRRNPPSGRPYVYRMTVNPNGDCTLSVEANNMAPVSFLGYLAPLTW